MTDVTCAGICGVLELTANNIKQDVHTSSLLVKNKLSGLKKIICIL